MRTRSEYCLQLPPPSTLAAPAIPPGFRLAAARRADGDALAELMLAAYRDTIDYAGETQADARQEVAEYFEGECGGAALLDCSALYWAGAALVSACLISHWDERGHPLVAYVMTHPDYKGQGLAKRLVTVACRLLGQAGCSRLYAVVTDGNTSSERVFSGLGFQRLGQLVRPAAEPEGA